ncbi:type I secretion system permease/ATPase [Nisaea acidiphila]|uniref:Type I secretion system permease/ATPase n=1 Tax=Nisaea acidiphila TaxID=1862145 RepID=A0A9J7AP72_9PROT|nr:type I secretion system permease/ATPase [Nisaea acidiphila]UUX48393.1 type I secretion system permease/ATPase [Nisaea acidiphila]
MAGNPSPSSADQAVDDPLRRIFEACRGAFVTAGVFSFVVNMLILTMPLYMFSLFDRVLGTGNMATLTMLALIAFAALLVQALIDIARTYLFTHVSSWIDAQISPQLFERSVTGSLVRGRRGGDALENLQGLRQFLGSPSVFMLMDLPFIPIFMIVLFLLNFAIGMTAAIGGAILFGLALANKIMAKSSLAKASTSANQARKLSRAAVENADIVEAMGMRKSIMSDWASFNEYSLRSQNEASQIAGIIQAFIKMFRMGIMMAVMTVAAIQIVDPASSLSRGAMMASVILVSRALMPLEAIVGSWGQVADAVQRYRFLASILNGVSAKPEDSVFPLDPKGQLSVENVHYHVRGMNRAILSRVSFELAPGESVAIIGPSAAGKTSLARLIAGIESPTSGVVRLDGADVYRWPSEDRGRHVGYLPQQVLLFEGSIRDNISRFDKTVTNEQVIQAAEMAGLHRMILKMEQGYDTPVGPGGSLLSGGQRQRVGLARALLGDPKLVLLDEPNANLDTEGDQALKTAIESLTARGATVVVILHRPNILQIVDKILVLREGVVQKFSNRDDVMPLIGGVPSAPSIDHKSAKAVADN